MRTLLMILIFSGLNSPLLAGGVKEVHVERRGGGEVLGEFILPAQVDGKGYVSKEVWRSPKGIACTVSLFEHSSEEAGTFECVSPERYKAQVALDCSENSSRETAVYLFFGMVANENEVGNFYVWCE